MQDGKIYNVAFVVGAVALGYMLVADWHPLLEMGLVFSIYLLGRFLVKNTN